MNDTFLQRRANQVGKTVAQLKTTSRRMQRQMAKDRELFWPALISPTGPLPAERKRQHAVSALQFSCLAIGLLILITTWASTAPAMAVEIGLCAMLPTAMLAVNFWRLASAPTLCDEEKDHE